MDHRTSWVWRVLGQDSENFSKQLIENGAVCGCRTHAGKARRETLGTPGYESECVLVALGNQSRLPREHSTDPSLPWESGWHGYCLFEADRNKRTRVVSCHFVTPPRSRSPKQGITDMWARLGFTRRLLVTSTAKKCEPVAGGPTTPSIKVSRLERWSSPTPFPRPPLPGCRGGVSKCTNPVDRSCLRRRVKSTFMPCAFPCSSVPPLASVLNNPVTT